MSSHKKFVIQRDLFGQYFILETTDNSHKKSDTKDTLEEALEETKRRIVRQMDQLHKNLLNIPVEGRIKLGRPPEK